MTRFLCASLLFLVALPLLAQEESTMPLERSLPRGNQATLMNMRQRLTRELQQIQQMISVAGPNDTQFIDTLKAQQTELTKQIKDVTQQLQTFEGSGEGGMGMMPLAPPSMPGLDSMSMPNMPGGMMPGMGAMPTGMLPQQTLPTSPRSYPEMQSVIPLSPTQSYIPSGVMGGMMPDTPTGIDQDRMWGDNSPWGPRTSSSKELTEMKQSVESLRKEIAGLKETVRTLETQIQLLNRNILLSERARLNLGDANERNP